MRLYQLGKLGNLDALKLTEAPEPKLEPVIDRVFDFNDARAAYEHLASGRHFGKVVISMGRGK